MLQLRLRAAPSAGPLETKLSASLIVRGTMLSSQASVDQTATLSATRTAGPNVFLFPDHLFFERGQQVRELCTMNYGGWPAERSPMYIEGPDSGFFSVTPYLSPPPNPAMSTDPSTNDVLYPGDGPCVLVHFSGWQERFYDAELVVPLTSGGELRAPLLGLR